MDDDILNDLAAEIANNECVLFAGAGSKQADGEIHEDQLLNFLVNRLDEEVSLSLANNAEITAEDIYEVLVGACADGTSVSTLCASSQNSPAGNTVLYHLRTKFEPERLERVANTPAKGSR